MSMKCELFFYILCSRGDLHTTAYSTYIYMQCVCCILYNVHKEYLLCTHFLCILNITNNIYGLYFYYIPMIIYILYYLFFKLVSSFERDSS